MKFLQIQVLSMDIKKIMLYIGMIFPYAKPPINDFRWKAPRPINQPENLILT